MHTLRIVVSMMLPLARDASDAKKHVRKKVCSACITSTDLSTRYTILYYTIHATFIMLHSIIDRKSNGWSVI